MSIQPEKDNGNTLSGNIGGGRYSKYSKLFGDRAEEIVYQVLTEKRIYKLRWVAKEKEKPGWDIEYFDDNNLVAVEVKGTSGKRFPSIDITFQEWNAAKDQGEYYRIYLVADCLSKSPKIQVIANPYELYLNKKISLQPIAYRLRLTAQV
jgi:hypothetical protein